jgi:hypothetical protein
MPKTMANCDALWQSVIRRTAALAGISVVWIGAAPGWKLLEMILVRLVSDRLTPEVARGLRVAGTALISLCAETLRLPRRSDAGVPLNIGVRLWQEGRMIEDRLFRVSDFEDRELPIQQLN